MADNSGGSLKIILGLIMALGFQFGVLAAGPAVPYSAFNANDFKIINGQIFLRVHVVGGTNLFVTNLYSQTIVTTNFYVTNFISGDTIVTINTNVYLTNTYLFLNGSNVASVNPTDGYLPKRQSATNFVDSLAHDDGSWLSVDGSGEGTLQLMTDDGQVVFGSGGTNVMKRSGTDILMTNGATITRFGVQGPSGTAYIGMNSGDAQVTGGSAVHLLNKNSNGIIVSDSNVGPSADGAISLAGPSTSAWWYDLGLMHKLYVAGFRGGGGSDYSRLAISHGGTNDGIHFVSQAAGTAGSPRDFLFEGGMLIATNPTIARIEAKVGSHVAELSTQIGVSQLGSTEPLLLAGDTSAGILGTVDLANNGFYPPNGLLPLGKDNGQWGPLTIGGFNDGTGANYSQLKVSHGGTNDAIHFDSQSAGTAGPPRDFQFTNAVLRADATKGIELGGITRTAWPGGPASSTLRRLDFGRTNIWLGNLSPAFHDFWTVPAGYWAISIAMWCANTNASSSVVYAAAKTNSNYFFVHKSLNSFSTNSFNSASQISFPYSENEVVALTNTVQGVNAMFSLIYFPTNLPDVKIFKQYGFDGSTTNLIYTCPSGKTASWFIGSEGIFGANGEVDYINNSASSAFVQFFVSSSSPGTDTLVYSSTVLAGKEASIFVPPLLPGQSIYLYSSLNDPNQIAWMILAESEIK